MEDDHAKADVQATAPSEPIVAGPKRAGQEEETVEADPFWDNHPLTMRELPADISSNPMLSAIQDLVYSGTPEEIAENFKRQGNALLKRGAKHRQDALVYYDKAIAAGSSDDHAVSIYHSNRAAVNLLLANYGKVIADCSKALELNGANVKAAYRGAKACIVLQKWSEAQRFCKLGLRNGPNKELMALKAKVNAGHRAIKAAAAKDAEEEERLQAEAATLAAALGSRGLTLGPKKYAIPRELGPRVNPGPPPCLEWPVLFLYPAYGQSDYVQCANEHQSLMDHMVVMFPPDMGQPLPWDTKGHFLGSRLHQLRFYVADESDEWCCVDPDKGMGAALAAVPNYVIPYHPVVHVVHESMVDQLDAWK